MNKHYFLILKKYIKNGFFGVMIDRKIDFTGNDTDDAEFLKKGNSGINHDNCVDRPCQDLKF